MGYCPFSTMCRNRVPRVATEWRSSAHDSVCSRRVELAAVCARSSAHRRDEEEGLPRQKIPIMTDCPQLLCRNRDCLAPCRDRTLVSRQGLGLGLGD